MSYSPPQMTSPIIPNDCCVPYKISYSQCIMVMAIIKVISNDCLTTINIVIQSIFLNDHLQLYHLLIIISWEDIFIINSNTHSYHLHLNLIIVDYLSLQNLPVLITLLVETIYADYSFSSLHTIIEISSYPHYCSYLLYYCYCYCY